MKQQDDEKTGFADSVPGEPAPVAAEAGHPVISGWSVVGYDRIVGTVFGHKGAASGKTIITSPVLQVLLDGDGPYPLARTQSGSLYALAQPSATFGTQQAEDFLVYKARATGGEPAGAPTPQMRTTLLKLEP